MNSYTRGQPIRLTAIVTVTGTPTPGTVVWTIWHQSGTVVTPATTGGGTPVGSTVTYTADITAALPEGRYHYRFQSTGTLVAAEEGELRVEDGAFA